MFRQVLLREIFWRYSSFSESYCSNLSEIETVCTTFIYEETSDCVCGGIISNSEQPRLLCSAQGSRQFVYSVMEKIFIK